MKPANSKQKKHQQIAQMQHNIDQEQKKLVMQQQEAERQHTKNMKMAEIQAKREDAVQEQLNRAFNEAMSAYRKELDNMRDQELNFQKNSPEWTFYGRGKYSTKNC